MENLTEKIRSMLVEGILNGRYAPGERIPSEREYAEETGTSRITVRRAYAQLEESGIIVRSRPGGTHVADTFRGQAGPLESVGVITTLPHAFSGRFVEAVHRSCAARDAIMALGIPEPDNADEQLKIAMRMVARGVKNLIVWGADRTFDFQVFERLRILGVNLVFFDQVIPGKFADYVGLDNKAAVQALFATAAERGIRNFTFITYNDLDVDTNMERKAAFLKCLAETADCSGRVLEVGRNAAREECRRVAAEAIASPRTAVIGVNAPILLQLFHLPISGVELFCVDYVSDLAELGAVGYRQPIEDMAEAAVKMLLDQQRKGDAWRAVQRRFKGELVLP